MKRLARKSSGVSKGTRSAVLLSILIHVGLFLLAGTLVIFTVVKQKVVEFEPPKAVERPKMKLKKPKVRIKKASKPKTTRIVSRTTRAVMPDLQLPEMSGMGDGLDEGVGVGGFDLLPNLETTIFGSGQTIGNDFVGYFYDFKRDRYGKPCIMDQETFKDKVALFVRSGFEVAKIGQYYRSPNKLYATCFMVPSLRSATAPKAFGEETGGWCWMVHYKGKLVHKDGITFRFRGQGDDILIVRVDGKIVLNGSWPGNEQRYTPYWQSNHSETRTYRLGNNLAVVGDWITLEPGKAVDMEVVGGEVPGGHFDMMLVVEEQGVDYPKNRQQGPILPMFKTAEPNHDLRDAIFEWLVPGEASITNGPVFCDFGYEPRAESAAASKEPEPQEPEPKQSRMRTWTLSPDRILEAEYSNLIGSKLTLLTPKGKQVTVSLDQLSAEDLEYVELMNPPVFDVDFTRQSSQRMTETTPFLVEVPPRIHDWTFGVKLKQTSARLYNHEIDVEYFAVGQQFLDDSKFILLDRGRSAFVPTNENDRSHQFKGDKTVEMMNYELKSQSRGEQYKGYLVLVRDVRGEIIQYAASNEWLYENRDRLVQLPVGNFFDKTCKRVHPTGPKPDY